MPRAPALVPAKIAQIAGAIRAFCVIYNTGLTYETTHAVFQKAIDERFQFFQEALADTEGIPLVFTDGQVRVGSVSIEPGSGMFHRLARQFENMGITSISILNGVSTEDIRGLIKIVTKETDAVRAKGLQHLLDRDRVKGVLEHKVTTVESDSVVSSAGKAHTGTASILSGRSAATAGSSGTWNLEADITPGVFTARDEDEIRFTRPFKDFVNGAMSALHRGEADPKNMADIIATEFRHRLNEKAEEIKKHSDRKIRHLESVQELILRELETRNIAAIILDRNLTVLSVNRQGRDVIGGIQSLERGSSLDIFVRSQEEMKEIEINGARKTAHLLTSVSVHGETIMLVSFE